MLGFALRRPKRNAAPNSALAGSAHANLRLVLCAGLYSSASTWMFNLLRLLLKQQEQAGLRALYLDELGKAAEWEIKGATTLLAKSHMPGPSLAAMLAHDNARLVMTIRDPRDAVASMMLRWNVAFELALSRIAKSAAALAKLTGHQPSLLFCYEDGFAQSGVCFDGVAQFLGIPVLRADRDRILADLTPQAVERQLAAWKRAGILGRGLPDIEFEPETHWHLGHLGDGAIGKWSSVLSGAQAARVQHATRRFCETFGYPEGDALDPGTSLSNAR